MNHAAERALTKALDASIAHVATRELGRLTAALSREETAKAILGSLRSLQEVTSVGV